MTRRRDERLFRYAPRRAPGYVLWSVDGTRTSRGVLAGGVRRVAKAMKRRTNGN